MQINFKVSRFLKNIIKISAIKIAIAGHGIRGYHSFPINAKDLQHPKDFDGFNL